MFADEERYGTTYAVVVVQGGRLLLERYGGALPHFDRPPEPVEPHTPLLSWSMAKSVLHAAVGVLVGEGRLRLDEPPGVPGWDDDRVGHHARPPAADARRPRWVEDYVDDGVSNVIAMLFGEGQDDVAAYAGREPARPPARHRLQLLVGHVEHRRRHRRSRGRRRRRCGRSCSTGCCTRSACAPPTLASTPPAPSSARRSSTPPPRTGPASACSTSATACGTASACCRRAGSTTAAASARSTRPTAASTAPTGGSTSSTPPAAPSAPAATRARWSPSARRSTPSSSASARPPSRNPPRPTCPPWRKRVLDALS